MNEIHSERELLSRGLSFGQWNFSISNDEINEKLRSFPKTDNVSGEERAYWKNLLSLVGKNVKIEEDADSSNNVSVLCLDEDTPMECSTHVDECEQRKQEDLGDTVFSVEDVTVCLVDSCNQVAQKLKTDLSCVEEELSSVSEDLHKLDESLVSQVMKQAWCQLHSDAGKMCYCLVFCVNSNRCEALCTDVLLPWMSKTLPTKLEQFSEVFSRQSEVFCKNLIAPLLQTEDSPLAKDLLSLEDLMSSMSPKHWTIVLKELLSGINELHGWIIPVLATVVEHSDPSFDDVCALVQLLSSAGLNFSKSRDFGGLLVAVAASVKPGFDSVVPQLTSISNGYKGPLKFKALKVLKDINE